MLFRSQAALWAIGPWSCPSPMRRCRRDRWQSLSQQERRVAHAAVLSGRMAGALGRLPPPLPVSSGEASLARRNRAEEPRWWQRLARPRQRLEPWAQRDPVLEIRA